MNNLQKTIVIIPARLGATRLPRKPLAMIHGQPMIVHVLKRGLEAGLGPVVVACCDEEIATVVQQNGGQAVITDPALPSGTDRIFAALKQIDPQRHYDFIVNLQGDLPFISKTSLQAVMTPFAAPEVDIATIAAPIPPQEDIHNPNIVKIGMALSPHQQSGRALYFSRQAIPYQSPQYLHHIGVYAYRRQALEQFVQAPPTLLEQTEKLEHLRALELGLRIDVQLVEETPKSVDTLDDLTLLNASTVYPEPRL